MLILLGPSASGKTESAKIMINRYPISRVVTCTTREKRVGEIDGFDYHFLTPTKFKQLETEHYFVETAEYNGHCYGTPVNEVADDKLIILEPKGLASFLKLNLPGVVAVYLKTAETCRIERMRLRKDKEESIEKRITSDRIDFDLEKITGLDLIIDTTNIALSDLADYIYKEYIRLLEEKQIPANQLSLF